LSLISKKVREESFKNREKLKKEPIMQKLRISLNK